MIDSALPSPGIHYNVPFATYCEWKLMNASTLCHGRETMEHLKAALDGELDKGDTAALRFGRALHARLLEPEVYAQEWLVAGTCGGTMGNGPRKGERCGSPGKFITDDNEWRCGKHGVDLEEPEQFIGSADGAKIERIAGKIREHAVVKLIRQHGGFEASIIWESQGVPLKTRVDKMITEGNCHPTIVDVKKVGAKRGSIDVFSRAILDYHYDLKAAMNVDAVKFHTGLECNFIWIVCEDSPPFSIGVYQIDPVTLELGRQSYKALLQSYKHALENDRWPGYCLDIKEAGLPEWRIKQLTRGSEL